MIQNKQIPEGEEERGEEENNATPDNNPDEEENGTTDPEEQDNTTPDNNIDTEEPDNPDNESISSNSTASTMSSSKDERLDSSSLKTKMEMIHRGCTKVVTGKPDHAHVVRFRTTMCMALRDEPNERHDLGYSYLADTEEGFRAKMGDPAATLPKMPSRPDIALATEADKNSNSF